MKVNFGRIRRVAGLDFYNSSAHSNHDKYRAVHIA
jgi:hypothetical protein